MSCHFSQQQVPSRAPAIRTGQPWNWKVTCPGDISSWDSLAWTVTDPEGSVLLHLTSDEGLQIVNEHTVAHHQGCVLIESGFPPHITITLAATATRLLPPAHQLQHQLTLYRERGLTVKLDSGPMRIVDGKR